MTLEPLKTTWPTLAIFGVIVAFVCTVGGCLGGVDANEMVKVTIPDSVRDPGQVKSISVTEAKADFTMKNDRFRTGMTLYAANITGGEERAEALNGLFEWLGASLINVGSVTIPGWGILGGSTGLTFLLGALGVKKPGTFSKTEIDAEYDKGRNEAVATMTSVASITSTTNTNTNG